MTEKAVAIRPDLTPSEVIENATTQAKLLMNIVEQTGCFQLIAKKKYLQVEAWETIGAFNRTHAETESISQIVTDGQVIGYQAKVQLWKDGQVIGGAVMPCYFTENCCKGKEGDAKHKACMSAAQTFATSKAYRMNFSYVAILAGYQPTPAEEMTGEDTLGDVKRDTTDRHYCFVHKTPFFKKGSMKGYAHPIGDTGEWCNEHKDKEPEPTPETAQGAPQGEKKPVEQETGNKTPEEAEQTPETVGFMNMTFFDEAIKTLQNKGIKAYSNKMVLSYLNAITGKKAESIHEALANLSEAQTKDYIKKISEDLSMA